MLEEFGLKELLAEPQDLEELHIPQNIVIDLMLRLLPAISAELAAGRQEKLETIQQLLAEQNTYLTEHPRATVAAAPSPGPSSGRAANVPGRAKSAPDRTANAAIEASARVRLMTTLPRVLVTMRALTTARTMDDRALHTRPPSGVPGSNP